MQLCLEADHSSIPTGLVHNQRWFHLHILQAWLLSPMFVLIQMCCIENISQMQRKTSEPFLGDFQVHHPWVLNFTSHSFPTGQMYILPYLSQDCILTPLKSMTAIQGFPAGWTVLRQMLLDQCSPTNSSWFFNMTKPNPWPSYSPAHKFWNVCHV